MGSVWSYCDCIKSLSTVSGLGRPGVWVYLVDTNVYHCVIIVYSVTHIWVMYMAAGMPAWHGGHVTMLLISAGWVWEDAENPGECGMCMHTLLTCIIPWLCVDSCHGDRMGWGDWLGPWVCGARRVVLSVVCWLMLTHWSADIHWEHIWHACLPACTPCLHAFLVDRYLNLLALFLDTLWGLTSFSVF